MRRAVEFDVDVVVGAVGEPGVVRAREHDDRRARAVGRFGRTHDAHVNAVARTVAVGIDRRVDPRVLLDRAAGKGRLYLAVADHRPVASAAGRIRIRDAGRRHAPRCVVRRCGAVALLILTLTLRECGHARHAAAVVTAARGERRRCDERGKPCATRSSEMKLHCRPRSCDCVWTTSPRYTPCGPGRLPPATKRKLHHRESGSATHARHAGLRIKCTVHAARPSS